MGFMHGLSREEPSTRMLWPEASMTWEQRNRLRTGDVFHRDASSALSVRLSEGSTLYSGSQRFFSRQDAPRGSGDLIIHSPRGLETLSASRRAAFPSPAGLASPRTRTAGMPVGHKMPLRPPLMEPYRNVLHTTFPRVTAHNPRDKSELYASRAAARWHERVKEREAAAAFWD